MENGKQNKMPRIEHKLSKELYINQVPSKRLTPEEKEDS